MREFYSHLLKARGRDILSGVTHMTRRGRFRLFLTLAIFFLIASPVIIFWSQGYRFDWKTRSFVQVGGLYVNVTPRDAELVIDGVGSRRLRSSLLSEGTLFGNLIPGTYDISVRREGYFPWSKSLAIHPLQVTKASSITLFPTIPAIESLGAFAASDFWPVEGNNHTFYFSDPSGKRLYVFEGGRQHAKPQQILGPSPEAPLWDRIIDLEISPDGSMLLVKLSKDTVVADASGSKIRSLARYFTQLGMPVNRFETLTWHPAGNQKLIGITSQNRMYEIDLAASTYRRLLADETLVGFDQTGTLAVGASGNLYRLSAKREGVEKIEQLSLPPNTTRLVLYDLPQRQYLLLDQNANLWHLERDAAPRLIAEGIVGAWPHPDGSRVALIAKNQVLSIYFLVGTSGDVSYERGTILKLGLVEQNPTNVFWMRDNWHVLLVESGQIEIVEIDSRFPINRVSYPIAASRAFWSYDQNTLRYASQGALWSWRFDR